MKLRGLYRKTDSGIYYYQPPQKKGVRPRPISLETKSEKEAIQKYHEIAEQSAQSFAGGSIRMEAARFVAAKRDSGEHTSRTSEESEAALARLIDCVGNLQITAVRGHHLERYRQDMVARGAAQSTIRSELGRISSFFTWAQRESIVEINPARSVSLPRSIPTRSERYCTKDERDRLIATLPKDRIDLQLVFWIGFFAGLRKGEIVEARRDWIDLEAGVITVRNTDTFVTKDKAHRLIRISPRLLAFLTDYLDQWGDLPGVESGYLLRPDVLPGRKVKTRGKKAWRYRFDVRRSFATHCRAQSLDWVHFHTMRHTFATLHALAGTPLTTIARELGDDAEITFRNYVGYTRHGGHESAVD